MKVIVIKIDREREREIKKERDRERGRYKDLQRGGERGDKSNILGVSQLTGFFFLFPGTNPYL